MIRLSGRPSLRIRRDSLPRQLAREVCRHYLTLERIGQKLPNEEELARQFDVSRRTVRDAVGFLVHDGLLDRRHGSGTYVPDLKQRRHIALLAGVIFARTASTGMFQLHVMRALVAELRAHHLGLRIYAPQIDPAADQECQLPFICPDLVSDLERGLVNAVVGVSANPHPSWMKLARASGVPLIGTGDAYPYYPCVDHAAMVELGVQALADAGSRRIALMCRGDAGPGPSFHDHFRTALTRRKLSYHPQRVCDQVDPLRPGDGWRQFIRLWADQAGQARAGIDGLLITDDNLYREVAPAILATGIDVPRQLRVASLFNQGIDMLKPFPTFAIIFDPAAIAHSLANACLTWMETGRLPSRKAQPLGFALAMPEPPPRPGTGGADLRHAPTEHPHDARPQASPARFHPH